MGALRYQSTKCHVTFPKQPEAGYRFLRQLISLHVREYGFRNPRNFGLSNPESWALESGM